MKYLGIDFGTKRVGIATSDDNGEFAFPKEILTFSSNLISGIKAIADKEGIDTVVLGYSVASNDMPNKITGQVEEFKKDLEKNGLKVEMEREGYSSVEAHRYQQTKGPADDRAAAIILQRFLDKNKKTN